jgi:hypothetical protein
MARRNRERRPFVMSLPKKVMSLVALGMILTSCGPFALLYIDPQGSCDRLGKLMECPDGTMARCHVGSSRGGRTGAKAACPGGYDMKTELLHLVYWGGPIIGVILSLVICAKIEQAWDKRRKRQP